MWITRTSPLTGTTRSLDLPITESQMQKRREGALIQNAFPNLSASEREFYMTGIVDEEWDELMQKIGAEE